MAEIRVSALCTYPIKSCAGLLHDHIMLGSRGFLHDREWMVVDSSGTFITQREIPRMALIKPVLDSSGMTVNAPDMPTLRVSCFSPERERRQITVWRYQGEAEDSGDVAAGWFSMMISCDENDSVNETAARPARLGLRGHAGRRCRRRVCRR